MPVDVRSTSCEVLAAKRIVSGQIAHMAVEGRAGAFRYVRLWRMGRKVSRQVGATSVTSWMQAETLNDAETLCGTTFYPEQKMKILGNPDAFSLRQRVSNLGPLTVGEIAFGTDVRLDCGELHDSYHVNIPISGHIESENRGVRAIADPEYATVYQPDVHTALPYWPEATRLLYVKFDRSVVDDAVRDALGNPTTEQIDFGHTMQIHSGAGRSWTQMVMMLNDQVSRPDSILHEPMVGLPFIDSLVRGLLVVADHPYHSAVVKPVRPARSRLVDTAVEIIEADAHLPLTVSLIAARSRGSVRSLQQGFHREMEMTPMAYVREVRLRRAHRALRDSDPSVTTVASIAHQWGFTNLGRFAEAHAARYGEPPAVTLRRTLFPR
jgi:AraC-like DNA-binding protein